MAEIDAEVKKWGNSLGIRVPAALAHEQGIEPGDVIRVRIEKVVPPNPEFFGMAKRLGIRTPTRAQWKKFRAEEREREKASWARKFGRDGRTRKKR